MQCRELIFVMCFASTTNVLSFVRWGSRLNTYFEVLAHKGLKFGAEGTPHFLCGVSPDMWNKRAYVAREKNCLNLAPRESTKRTCSQAGIILFEEKNTRQWNILLSGMRPYRVEFIETSNLTSKAATSVHAQRMSPRNSPTHLRHATALKSRSSGV